MHHSSLHQQHKQQNDSASLEKSCSLRCIFIAYIDLDWVNECAGAADWEQGHGRNTFSNKFESFGRILEITEVANAYVIAIKQRNGNVAIVEQMRTNYIVVRFGQFAKVGDKGIVICH